MKVLLFGKEFLILTVVGTARGVLIAKYDKSTPLE
jgi:hypothetical protein